MTYDPTSPLIDKLKAWGGEERPDGDNWQEIELAYKVMLRAAAIRIDALEDDLAEATAARATLSNEVREALREARDLVSAERECLIESYSQRPKDGQPYDIETISDRRAYKDVVEYGALVARIDALLTASNPKEKPNV